MKALLYLSALLILCGCASQKWESPYPEVPTTVPPEKKHFYTERGIRYDAVEKNPKYKTIFQTIDAEVDASVKKAPYYGQFGFVHTFYAVKRRTLYWKYSIDWHSIADMNPNLCID